ncbi:purine-nucleoside phosphorylase [soil metagenome]
MTTPHNQANPGDYAEAVLLPGDPARAEWIAKTFLENARCVNRVRNCFGFTGSYKGKPVSVQATGMGQPSAAIYVHELVAFYGVKTLVRVGTCGGLSRKVRLRDIVIAQTAHTNHGVNRAYFAPYDFAPAADFNLVRRAADYAASRSLGWHVGSVVSDDVFYADDQTAKFARLVTHGALGVEMEASVIYTIAAKFDVAALAICTMTDDIATHQGLTPEERQSSLYDMIEVALHAALPL